MSLNQKPSARNIPTRCLKKSITKTPYFAIHLIKSLRAKGYAITESKNAIVDDNYYPMTYIINNRKDNLKSYELILFIGKYRLARFYEIKKDGSLKHNSNWSVKQ